MRHALISLLLVALLLTSPVGAAVSYISGDSAQISSGGDVAVTKPASLADDDVLLTVCMQDSPTGGTTWSTSDGFTEVVDAIFAGDRDKSCYGSWRVIVTASGEPSTYTFSSTDTGEEAVCAVLNFRGVDTSTPLDATTTTADLADTDTPSSPSITTTTNDAMLVVALGTTQGGSSRTCTEPSAFTQAIEDTDDDANSNICTGYELQASAGPSGAKQWTWNGPTSGTADHCALTFALRESGASPPAGGRRFYVVD